MLYLCYLCRFKPLRDHLRGFLIAAWAGDKIAEFSFPEISFHFPLRPWFFCKPRVCGEKSSGSVCMPGHAGSPPRMRGKVIHSLCDRPQRGITPAYAGKSQTAGTPCSSVRDHPRMCGEKPRIPGIRRTKFGITPAYAGKRQGQSEV